MCAYVEVDEDPLALFECPYAPLHRCRKIGCFHRDFLLQLSTCSRPISLTFGTILVALRLIAVRQTYGYRCYRSTDICLRCAQTSALGAADIGSVATRYHWISIRVPEKARVARDIKALYKRRCYCYDTSVWQIEVKASCYIGCLPIAIAHPEETDMTR